MVDLPWLKVPGNSVGWIRADPMARQGKEDVLAQYCIPEPGRGFQFCEGSVSTAEREHGAV